MGLTTSDIDGRTRLCALIGDPVSHSLSPAMHNAAFRSEGLNLVYIAFRVGEEGLGAALEGMREFGFLGSNVTIPYKRRVMGHLDEIDEEAGEIGAVNTIINRNGVLKGYNTDGMGAVDALKRYGYDLEAPGKVLIVGAGESARAIGYCLGRYGKELLFSGRTSKRRDELAVSLARFTGCRSVGQEEIADHMEGVTLVINCTPLGMKGFPGGPPLRVEHIRKDMTVFDIVYTPMRTALLREAGMRGARTVPGYEMLLSQGALSFEIWTGRKAPAEVMRKAVLERLLPADHSEVEI